jgi:pimeloyl-ACP methyl ester carboxylesterase
MIAVVLALFLALAPPSATPSGGGHWEGVMRRGTSTLSVRFDIADTTPSTGTFSAPDLGAIDIPLSHLRRGPTIHWELAGDTSTTVFDMTVAGNAMTGRFRENGHPAGTLTLRRTSDSTAKPYTTQAVAFTNGAVHLSGTMFVPRAPGKHPAAVLVHGSGPEGRWATAYIADELARRGVLTLTYDKRGVGQSTGDWKTASLEDLTGDARAAVHVLALRRDVDRARVGVYGHSQGAEIAPAIAENNPEVRWLCAADGPVGPQYYQDLFRVNTMLVQNFHGTELIDAKKLYAEFVDVSRNGDSHVALRADIAKARNAPWLAALAIPDDSSWIWNWYRKVGNYDNTQAWAAVDVPVLVVFGANDTTVNPKSSIVQTVDILRRNAHPRVVVRVFPGADHSERLPAAGPDGWPHNAPGFPDVVAAFALHPQTGGAR